MPSRTRQPPENSATGALVPGRFEAEAVHDGGGARPRAITVDGFERRIQLRQRHGRIAPLGVLDGGLHAAQLRIAVQHELDRRPGAGGDLLFHVRDLEAAGSSMSPASGAELAADRGEQTGLARAVGAGDADLTRRERR